MKRLRVGQKVETELGVGTVVRKKCARCGKLLIEGTYRRGEGRWEYCVRKCGPQNLIKLLSF
jgi:hypothetical protein